MATVRCCPLPVIVATIFPCVGRQIQELVHARQVNNSYNTPRRSRFSAVPRDRFVPNVSHSRSALRGGSSMRGSGPPPPPSPSTPVTDFSSFPRLCGSESVCVTMFCFSEDRPAPCVWTCIVKIQINTSTDHPRAFTLACACRLSSPVVRSV